PRDWSSDVCSSDLVSQYLVGTVYVVLFALAGLLPTLTREIPWRTVETNRWRATALALTRGLAMAVPPLFVFNALFAAADANYQRLLQDLFNFDATEMGVRALLIATYAWLCGGVLREMLLAP